MWQVLKRTVLHDALPWVRLSSEHVRLPNGVEIEDFYRVEINPYVMMFVLRPDRRVVMVEHYKHGPQEISLELPAGYIDPADTPLSAAQRELREETGLASDHWQGLGRYFIDGNRGCGWVHAFLATDAQPVAAPQREPTELMTIHDKTLPELFALWQRGQIINAASMGIIGRALYEIGYFNNPLSE